MEQNIYFAVEPSIESRSFWWRFVDDNDDDDDDEDNGKVPS